MGRLAICVLGLILPFMATADDAAKDPIGRSLSQTEISALDSHIFADGSNLPEGQGSIESGRDLYNQHCGSCHGGSGEGGSALELVGDRILLTTEFPDKGIAVYWPYASTLYQYVQRAMPPDRPGSFSSNELYALVGYVLFLNDLLPETGVVNRETLANIKLPNRDGFIDQFTDPE